MTAVPDSPARLRLDLAYDGTDFHGWAAQPGRRTVEGELRAALARVTRREVPVTVAGRTDAGVHASGQVVHLDLDAEALAALPGRSDRAPADALVQRLGGVLPADIVVRRARPVPPAFDARFGALWRRYRYRLSDSPQVHDPLRRDVLRHRRVLDPAPMHEAAQLLVGEHDFLSYCRPRPGATTVRTLQHLSVERPATGRADAGLVVVTVQADAFCHHMVRSLVGALLAVGEGRRDVDWPARVLAARTRDAAGRDGVGAAPMCPPQGLTLEHVEYPPDEMLAERAALSRAVRALTDDTPAVTWNAPHAAGSGDAPPQFAAPPQARRAE
ncbi:tRNA pseudouridine(38-40) synthase TruA [Brachybacterium sp. EF45031]|uniref:tRNA pseudouridine(38-40) synthase TruA n=1 Tax=Brachybacterium sillae TaxID=2810536 RepID=UPI00217D2353|nr:tRNA pseudouridine(38-40) synthase TruA [Brachybacterium sillae]MCS6711198.1 tRNA pseudouridine(38-40) synthase TruA [Brachybacterium sillae]